MGLNPGETDYVGLYKWMIDDNTSAIQQIHHENGFLQRIRERSDRWETVEICREIMFINGQTIQKIMREIEYDRGKVEEFSRILRGRSSNLGAGDGAEAEG
jgi:hypothetical protein